jgi:hypothetical protein
MVNYLCCADDDWDSSFESLLSPICSTGLITFNYLSYLELVVAADTSIVATVATFSEDAACADGTADPVTPFTITLSESCITGSCAPQDIGQVPAGLAALSLQNTQKGHKRR